MKKRRRPGILDMDSLIKAASIGEYKNWMEEEEALYGISLEGEAAQEEDYSRLELSCTLLDGCRYTGCDFKKSSFVDVVFQKCDFSNCSFQDAFFQRCEFISCKCMGTDFSKSKLFHVLIQDCNFRYASLNLTALEQVDLETVDFTDASVAEVRMKEVHASGSQFINTNFFKTRLKGFDFSENELADLVVSDQLTELAGCKITPVQAMELVKLLGVEVK